MNERFDEAEGGESTGFVSVEVNLRVLCAIPEDKSSCGADLVVIFIGHMPTVHSSAP